MNMMEIGPEVLGATKEEAEKMAADLKQFFMDKGISPNRAVSGAMMFVQTTVQLLVDSGFFDAEAGAKCDCPKCKAERKEHLKVVPHDA